MRLVQLWQAADEGVAVGRMCRRPDRQGTNVHPADLDAVVQVCLLPSSDSQELRIPFAIESALIRDAANEGVAKGLWAVCMLPMLPMLSPRLVIALQSLDRTPSSLSLASRSPSRSPSVSPFLSACLPF